MHRPLHPSRNEFSQPWHGLTLEGYRQLEAEGRVNRPLTDGPMRPVQSLLQEAPDTPSKGPDTRTGSLREGSRSPKP